MSNQNSRASRLLQRLGQVEIESEPDELRLQREKRLVPSIAAAIQKHVRAPQSMLRPWLVGGGAGFGLGLAAGLALTVLPGTETEPGSSPVATLTEVAGTVRALRADGTIVAGKLGRSLALGDRLKVEKSSRSAMKMRSGAVLSLGENSRLLLEASPSTAWDEVVGLEEGWLAAKVPKLAKGHRLSVVTPEVRVVVIGTRFSVVREERGDVPRTCVSVSEGRVRLMAANGSSELGAPGKWSSDGLPCEGLSGHRGGGAHPRSLELGSEPPQPFAPSDAPRAPAPSVRGPLSAVSSGTAGATIMVDSSTLREQNELFLAAVRARQRGDVALAVDLWKQLLQGYPSSPLRAAAEDELARARAEEKHHEP